MGIRTEYPRPQMVRKEWMNLNGSWEFDFDDENRGLSEHWHREGREFRRTIVVPFPYQSALSGLGTNDIHDVVWYRRSFEVARGGSGADRVLLHFGAVDYLAHVWINSELATIHEGGHSSFTVDITHLLNEDSNQIVVRCEDVTTQLDQPRGKQFWQSESESIFYTRTTGIWQTVWLENVGPLSIARLKLTPDVHTSSIQVECEIAGAKTEEAATLEVSVSLRGEVVAKDTAVITGSRFRRQIGLDLPPHPETDVLWSPEYPNLFDLVLTVRDADGNVRDQVDSYFGLRSIEVRGGKVLLNNRPYFMKLVLDQGYFPDGILTAPSDDAIRQDVEITKQLGFNGARKHQKVEDPRYLYWCDRLGLLVWGEMANCFAFSDQAIPRMMREWQEVVERDYNHPCIVAWVPVNESWGVPNLLGDARQRAHTASLYYLTKSLDPTRLAISNDGWEHTLSDLLTIHDYESRAAILKARYQTTETILNATPGGKLLVCEGFPYRGQPILLTEFGGIAFKVDREGWGYSVATSEEDFLARYDGLVRVLLESPAIQGFCYTQLTDVEQETNGLLTYDRRPKAPIDRIRQINQGNIDG